MSDPKIILEIVFIIIAIVIAKKIFDGSNEKD